MRGPGGRDWKALWAWLATMHGMRAGLRRPMGAHGRAHLLLVKRLTHCCGLMRHAHHGHSLLLLLLLRRYDHSLLLHHHHALLRHRRTTAHLLLLNGHSHGHLLLWQDHHPRPAANLRRHSWSHLHPLRLLLTWHELRLLPLDHHLLRLLLRNWSGPNWQIIISFLGLDAQGLLLLILVIIDEHGMLPGLLPDFVESLLNFLSLERNPIQVALVAFVELVPVFSHRSLLRVEGLQQKGAKWQLHHTNKSQIKIITLSSWLTLQR